MLKKNVDILLIALSTPIMVGIYENGTLIESIISEEKSSDILAVIYQDILEKYNVEKFLYVNGPGSFMAIKVAYIFLKSLSILKNIPLFASDAFKFNENTPIKAIGKLYFVNIQEEIKTQKLDNVEVVAFKLPQTVNYDEFSTNTTPLYKIGAVG